MNADLPCRAMMEGAKRFVGSSEGRASGRVTAVLLVALVAVPVEGAGCSSGRQTSDGGAPDTGNIDHPTDHGASDRASERPTGRDATDADNADVASASTDADHADVASASIDANHADVASASTDAPSHEDRADDRNDISGDGADDSATHNGECVAPSAAAVWTTTESVASIGDIWPIASDDAWMVVDEDIQHWDGATWSPTPKPSGFTSGAFVRASGPTDVWISGAVSVSHWDGSTWSDLSPSLPSGASIEALWVFAPDEAWLITQQRLGDGNEAAKFYRWNGSSWAPVLSPTDTEENVFLYALWGSGPHDLWAGGNVVLPLQPGGNNPSNAMLLHWDGNVWTRLSPSFVIAEGSVIEALWGTSSRDIWAAGGSGVNGVMWHFDGEGWTTFPSADNNQALFTGIWGGCATSFWAIAANEVWHFNGSTWSRDPVATPSTLQFVRGVGADDVWSAGFRRNPSNSLEILGAVLHRHL